jgi:catechol 2,3-dioxygenase-like lactoylglutathione lyase family enzyme
MEITISNLLKSYENGHMSRRQLIQSLALMTSAATAGTSAPAAPLPASSVNHIAITVSDVKKSSDWYKELFGLVPEQDTATVAVLGFGNTVLVLRPGQNPGRLTHFCFGVKGFNMAQAEAELRKRGLDPRKDNESFHVKDPDGTDVQISSPDAR